MTVDQFVTMERPDVEWLVPNVIPRPSLMLLMGMPKSGKSFLAMDVGRRIANGIDLFGHPSAPTKVLYLMHDTREVVWRNTLRDLKTSGVEFGDNFVLAHPGDWMRPINILTEESRDWFKRALDTAQPGFVILDVFREVHNGDENDSTAMKIVGDQVEKTFKDVALLMLHHSRKIPADVIDPDPATYGRGSSYLMGKVDGMWMLHNGVLRMDTRFDEVRRLKGVRLENGFWDFPEIAEKQKMVDGVLALCGEFPDLAHNAIAKTAKDRYGISRATYFRMIGGRDCVHRTSLILHGEVGTREKIDNPLPSHGKNVPADVNPTPTEEIPDA